MSGDGGVPTEATTLDPTTGETHHRWPHFLPDGRHFLYTASTGTCCPPAQPAMVKVGSLDPGDATITLFQAESSALYASRHVLFARDETLMAQPFEPKRLQLAGEAFPVAEDVATEGSRYLGASVSENGTLVYAPGGGETALYQLTWFDRAGRALGTVGDPAFYANLALSPDERHVAVAQGAGSPPNVDIWIIDIARNVPSRLTFEPGPEGSPVWSPDGARVAFESARSGQVSIRHSLANGAGGDELVLESSTLPASRMQAASPTDWSADGRFIAYTQRTSSTTSDLWVLPLFGDRKPMPLRQTEFLEVLWRVLTGWTVDCLRERRSGPAQRLRTAVPGAGGRYQVSRNGGSHPQWRSDGKELFYLGPDDTLMAVPTSGTGQFDFGPPQALFPTSMRRVSTSRVYCRREGRPTVPGHRPASAGQRRAADRRRQLDSRDPEIAMALTPGSRLGPYEVVAPLGAGGMGEVYRARDTKLDREVAIKVLPDLFAGDAERLARFSAKRRRSRRSTIRTSRTIYGLEESRRRRARW